MEDVAGRYGASGPIGFLELGTDGTYECFVLNGISADGCATFEGAGMSTGRWTWEAGAVSFHPVAEPLDLVVKLSGALAVPSADGLLLTVGATGHLLPRSVPRMGQRNEPARSDAASPHR